MIGLRDGHRLNLTFGDDDRINLTKLFPVKGNGGSTLGVPSGEGTIALASNARCAQIHNLPIGHIREYKAATQVRMCAQLTCLIVYKYACFLAIGKETRRITAQHPHQCIRIAQGDAEHIATNRGVTQPTRVQIGQWIRIAFIEQQRVRPQCDRRIQLTIRLLMRWSGKRSTRHLRSGR